RRVRPSWIQPSDRRLAWRSIIRTWADGRGRHRSVCCFAVRRLVAAQSRVEERGIVLERTGSRKVLSRLLGASPSRRFQMRQPEIPQADQPEQKGQPRQATQPTAEQVQERRAALLV